MNEVLIYKEKGKDAMYKIWHYGNLPLILYAYSNGGSIVFSDKLFPIKRGTLCYIGESKLHYTMPEKPDEYCRSKLTPTSNDFSSFILQNSTKSPFLKKFLPDNEVCAIVDEKDCEKIEMLFDELNNIKEDETHFDAIYTSALLKLLAYIDKYSQSIVPTPDNFISTAVMYINNNINYKITVDDVAEACHMSKYYFCRQFKKIIGLTVMDYILKSRIENAKNLLDTTSLSISEISEKCGFISCSYFSRVFKERLTQTPNEYRKKTKSVK